MVDEHNYHCLSRPVYTMLGLSNVTNLILSIYFGNYIDEYNSTMVPLLIINCPNLIVAIYELFDLRKRANKILKLEG